MRGSGSRAALLLDVLDGGPSSPRNFPEKDRLRAVQDNTLQALLRLVPVLKTQLELLDEVDLGADTNGSLLFSLAGKIRDLNSCYLQSKLHKHDLTKFMETVQSSGNVDIKDGLIFSRSGGRKTDIRTPNLRRLSFSANYSDNSSILGCTKLLEMSDLQYLFYLNAYYVPYLGLTEGRSMYQVFFGEVVKALLKDDTFQSPEGYVFHVLQEAVYPIHIITEFTVSLVECIVEIVMVVNSRLKTAGVSIEQRLDLAEFTHPTLDHLLECFNSKDKIFLGFKRRRILSVVNERDIVSPKGDNSVRGKDYNSKEAREQLRTSINWSTKMVDYHQALVDAVELYKTNCDVFFVKLQELKKTAADFRDLETDAGCEKMTKVEAYLSEALVYISHLRSFLDDLVSADGAYMKFYEQSFELLGLLNQLQEKYPIRYGTVVTPRARRDPTTPGVKRSSGRYSQNSNNASPRSAASSDLESSPSGDLESPRKDSPDPPLRTSGTGDYKGMFSRVLGSMFGK